MSGHEAMQRLLREQAAVATALRHNQGERKRRRDAAFRRAQPAVPRATLECALCILLLSDGNADVVRDYGTQRQVNPEILTEEAVRQYLTTPVERVAELQEAAREGRTAAAQRAKAFLAERSLVHWIRDLNETHGLAPGSSHVFAEAEARGARGSQEESVLPATPARTAKQWTKRFRRRWAGRVGRLSSHACGRDDRVTAKVFRTMMYTVPHQLLPKLELFSGPSCGTLFMPAT